MAKKKFIAQFDALFESGGDTTQPEEAKEAMDQFVSEKLEEAVAKKKLPKPKSKNRKSFSGLDVLLQSTSETAAPPPPPVNKRRLTVLLETEKLDELKKIARSEKVYLKDIIGELVADYLATQQK